MNNTATFPIIAIVGRPNVGKSTLFNRLTRSRAAIVADMPGVTRDRLYGQGEQNGRTYAVVDTGGLGDGDAKEGMTKLMAQQTKQAIQEADCVIFLVDARKGLTGVDQTIAQFLRETGKPVFVTVNKTEGLDSAIAVSDFQSLGLGQPHPIAASHGQGTDALIETILHDFPVPEDLANAAAEDKGIRIALIGRPNVGKSTLINRMLGEERVVVYDQPGTTRDSIAIPYTRHGKDYVLIDTAGVRRRGSVEAGVEKFSVIKTLQAIESANVVVLVVDASEGITEQDLHLLGYVLEAGRSLVIAVNKWDGLTTDQRDQVKSELERRLVFVNFAAVKFISALHGTGVGELYPLIEAAYKSAMQKLSTPQLTRILEGAVAAHQPPLVRGRRIKLRYAHAGGNNPPLIVIHGKQTRNLPDSYRRYLASVYRDRLQLVGTPIRIELKDDDNPYVS